MCTQWEPLLEFMGATSRIPPPYLGISTVKTWDYHLKVSSQILKLEVKFLEWKAIISYYVIRDHT